MTDKPRTTPSPLTALSPWMTRAEVAHELRITTRAVDNMRADGRLKAYTAGPRMIRFRRDEVETAMQPIEVGTAS